LPERCNISVGSACDEQYLPERRSGSKIFAGTALRRVPAPQHP